MCYILNNILFQILAYRLPRNVHTDQSKFQIKMCCDPEDMGMNLAHKVVRAFTQGPVETKSEISLRTFIYTIVIITHVGWTLLFLIHLLCHIVELPSEINKTEDKGLKIVLELIVIMEELTLLLVIVSFILPPVMPTRQVRLNTCIVLNAMIGVIGLLYTVPCLLCIERILFSIVGHSEAKNSRRRNAAETEHIEIIVSKIGVYVIIAVCATYLAVSSYRNQRHLRRRTTMEIFFSSQGKVHGAELIIMVGTLVMFGSLEEFHQSDAPKSTNEMLLTYFFPYFLLSLVFGVQLR